ncbi:DUF4177 domain-containing protein [Epibacterium ulvae]|uniref:DUF4177 domain-containing protein n=1 Tax=Epibacterium ulvae TaxID=1156985 RepID=UPI0024937033|nr:DUF4177 domain-containing protein [Epibacterium ulvae]
MQAYEYKVVPAPSKGTKAKGVRSPEGRFSNSIEILLNELALEGWEYQRAELLPSDERTGLTGSTTNWRNVLIFRRAVVAEDAEAPVIAQAPVAEPAPEVVHVAPAASAAPPVTATAGDPEAPPTATPIPGPGAATMLKDDGVEEVSPVVGVTQALRSRAAQRQSDGE